MYATFYKRMIQSCCWSWHLSFWYLAPKENLIYNELIWHFMYSYLRDFLGVTFRHKLKHSLLGVPRKQIKMSDFDESFWKLDYYVFIYFSTWSSLQAFCLLLGTADLRDNSLLARTISMACTIRYQRLFVPKLVFIGINLERSLEKNSCLNLFRKPETWQMKDSHLNKVAWWALSFSLPK